MIYKILNSNSTTEEKQNAINNLELYGRKDTAIILYEHAIKNNEFIYNTRLEIDYSIGVSIYDLTNYFMNNFMDDQAKKVNYVTNIFVRKYDTNNRTYDVCKIFPLIIATMAMYSHSEQLYDAVSKEVINRYNQYTSYRVPDDYDLYELCLKTFKYRINNTNMCDIELLADCLLCLDDKDVILLKEFLKTVELEGASEKIKKFIEYIL